MQSNRWYLSSTPSSTLLTTDPSSPSMTQSSSPTLQEHKLRECYIMLIKGCASGCWSSLLVPRWSWVWQIRSLPKLWSTGLTSFDWQTSPTPVRRPTPLPLLLEVGGVGHPGTAQTQSLGYTLNISRFSIGTKTLQELSPLTRWGILHVHIHVKCMYMYSVWGVRKWNGKIMSFCNNQKLCIH